MNNKNSAQPPNLTKLFVYGSLMRGFPLHQLIHPSKFLGEAEIFQLTYRMVSLGGFPAVTTCHHYEFWKEYGMPVPIQGEVYEVDEQTLRSCDRCEGHPDWYKRIPIRVRFHDDRRIDVAQFYFMPEEKLSPFNQDVPSGDWKCHRNLRDPYPKPSKTTQSAPSS